MKIDAIFIVGTGRSGTHFLCRSLRGFKNINDFKNGKENLDLLYSITNLSLTHKPLPGAIIDYYKTEVENAKKHNCIFLDQHHPNLFHVDQLIKEFPNAVFLATDRPTEQIVASMLNHNGVRRWVEHALTNNNYAFPNQFLGIKNRKEIDDLPVHVLCAKRVDAHNAYRDRLLKDYPNNVRKVNFVELVNGQYDYFQNLFTEEEFELFGEYREIEKADKSVLTKFTKDLDQQKLTEI